ncbi:hypothetical protein J3R30DRAFT_3801536 [Lentinula aciculospora]|uniref:NAD(P)-binding protein n=1 Tax=Lentinula aciculospora TaxID=153920 RepID=A0A9W9DHQ2_9AGAR|nr:hypothetical protein J3R30DRAFT_3801536 [Lentinula aciculospora]
MISPCKAAQFLFVLYTPMFSMQPPVSELPASLDFHGKPVLVTGANGGLGRAACLHYLQHNASTLIIAVRRLPEGEAVKSELLARPVRTTSDIPAIPAVPTIFPSFSQTDFFQNTPRDAPRPPTRPPRPAHSLHLSSQFSHIAEPHTDTPTDPVVTYHTNYLGLFSGEGETPIATTLPPRLTDLVPPIQVHPSEYEPTLTVEGGSQNRPTGINPEIPDIPQAISRVNVIQDYDYVGGWVVDESGKQQQWSNLRKNSILLEVAFGSMIAGLAGNIQNSAISEMEADLPATASQISLSLSLFILLQGIAISLVGLGFRESDPLNTSGSLTFDLPDSVGLLAFMPARTVPRVSSEPLNARRGHLESVCQGKFMGLERGQGKHQQPHCQQLAASSSTPFTLFPNEPIQIAASTPAPITQPPVTPDLSTQIAQLQECQRLASSHKRQPGVTR